MSINKDPSCIWCGTTGSPQNFVLIYLQEEGSDLHECEWCATSEWFRNKASKGKKGQTDK